jgi:molybdate transport system substrate-binding protein
VAITRVRTLLSVLAALGLLAGCGSGPSTGAAGSTGAAVADEVVVFAAASLTDAFTQLGQAFTDEYPGTSVTFGFAASSELARQVVEGAPADVFASADVANMAKVVDADEVDGEPATFATNRPTIIVPAGNPAGIERLEDLIRPGLVIVVCAPEVPCGSYASDVFDAAGVEVTPDSYEENVRAVVTKVGLGEADAGIAYETDADVDDRIDGVSLPDDLDVVAEYPMAVTAEARNPAAGRAFVDFTLGERGQAILREYGFGTP